MAVTSGPRERPPRENSLVLAAPRAGGRRRRGQNPLAPPGGHGLHQIGGVIGAELLHHNLQLPVGQAVDEGLLGLGGKFREHIGGQVLGAQAEQDRHFLGREILKYGGQVGGVHGGHHIPQALILFGIVQAGQHIAEHGNGCIGHRKSLLLQPLVPCRRKRRPDSKSTRT